VAGVVITALGCAALVSACGGSTESPGAAKTNVDTARVARSIEGTLVEKRHVHSKVVCPATVAAVPGGTFECIATITAAKPPHVVTRTPFLVTVQNNRGYVTYVGR
jgi:hypothetical protein